jgi:NCS1 family nucleobase:cation symporter-1
VRPLPAGVRLPKLKVPPEWGAEPVPPEARTLGALDMFVLWASLGVGLLVLAAGDWLVNGLGLNLAEVVGVSVVGSLVGAIMLAAAARHGSRHGVPTMVSLRPILGRRGSYVPSALNAFQLLGWATFEVLVMALAAAQLTGHPLGDWTAVAFVPLFGAIVLALALAGPLAVVRAWLKKFAIWAVLATTAFLAYAMLTSGVSLGGRPGGTASPGGPSIMLALDLVIVMPISWWPLVADYNRFAKSGRASWLGTVGGNALANAAYFVLGGMLVVFAYASVYGPGTGYADFLYGMSIIGLGGLPLFTILVDETDNAFANVYSTAVSVQNLRPRWRQAKLVIVSTAIASGGAAALALTGQGIGSSYNQFLIVIGGIFVPLLGVVVADAFWVRRRGYEAREFADGAPALRMRALAAWAPGTVLYLAIYFAWIPGFPAIGSTLPSFALSAALHVLLTKPPVAPAAAKTPA